MQNTDYESPRDIKTEIVLVRLTPTEKKLLADCAIKNGIGMSALVRLMLAQYTGKDLRFR